MHFPLNPGLIWFVQEGGDDEESHSAAQEGASEVATGEGAREEEDNLSDDISDAGWDTDLDIEGLWKIFLGHLWKSVLAFSMV